MADYRCYAFNSADDILEVEDIEGDSDEAAIEKSRRLQSHYGAFELWKRNRLIHRQDSPVVTD